MSDPILLVDDEPHILRSFEMALRMAGHDQIVTCDDSREAMQLIRAHRPEIVLLDLTMPHISGQELLSKIAAEQPGLPVVVVTGNDTVETAVECMKRGATDYLTKPVERDRLLITVRQARECGQLRRENRRLVEYVKSSHLDNPEAFAEIVTNSPAMVPVLRYAEAVARSRQPVLITGATGVGKELLARAIHRASDRSGELVAVNAAGIDAQLFDDALFGHVKGAFTGADRARRGMVDQADRGTLFLDEIGDLAPESQVKLLRLLQAGVYVPLGSDAPRQVNLRVVAATNRSLEELESSTGFRTDLYYRLATHHVRIPSLRERLEDIPLLVERFSREAAEELGHDEPDPPSQEVLTTFAQHGFPGNVRELRSLVFDAISVHGSLDAALEHLRARLQPADELDDERSSQSSPSVVFGPRLPTIEEAKDLLIAEAERRTGGNRSLAARMLGITRQAVNKRRRRADSSSE